jgi:YesN/AraC family two-component response regulator
MHLKKEDLAKANEIKIFLEKNYCESFDYDFLSKKYAINKLKLKLAFKSVVGDNIHSFINKLKIDRAKKLLEATDLNIGLIAVKIGLDKSNFNIQFRKITGKTPSQWRKELINE